MQPFTTRRAFMAASLLAAAHPLAALAAVLNLPIRENAIERKLAAA